MPMLQVGVTKIHLYCFYVFLLVILYWNALLWLHMTFYNSTTPLYTFRAK